MRILLGTAQQAGETLQAQRARVIGLRFTFSLGTVV
jgi:hypothetical protein